MEEKIHRRILRIRGIWGGIALLGLAILILFAVLYSDSREVVTVGGDSGTILGDWLKYEYVTYNYNLGFGIAAGVIILIWGLAFLLSSFFLKCYRISCGIDTLLLYRGFFNCELYLNDTLVDSFVGSFRTYLEAKLSDRSTATVTLSRWSGAHITFSNGRPPIDVY